MRIKRCAVLLLEPSEKVTFAVESLLRGGNGLCHELQWLALAPHLDAPVPVDGQEREALGLLSANRWTERSSLDCDAAVVDRLISVGLVLDESQPESSAALQDNRLRAAHWHPLAAVLHAFTRWEGVDSVKNSQDSGTETIEQMRRTLGPPPAEAEERAIAADQVVTLPTVVYGDFDALLGRRVTCRNFDLDRALPLETLSHMLQRVFAAKSSIKIGEDLVFLKKSVPSGGGLHPIEAYLLVQNVVGLAAGVYHYRADTHVLERLPGIDLTRTFVMEAVGQQHWFADAQVLVALVPRFARTFWKYRQHAKAYRVIAMEAGHLSQTLYLAATDLGLGAFITGAINEKYLERALSLDPITQGVLAVCGFGLRGAHMVTTELDPDGRIWSLPDGDPEQTSAVDIEGADSGPLRG
ncbi:putative peptide maturation dehydrogenase [Xanthomonas maliensis]|uniref:putative peptide maturation dehydrogenase n=2 Tax=Xanthomonas maliensis TaxID=1321368 RepID=UPI001264811B|nr:putative peptide maturation dehydrogenase [Xanthomonas maliensis]KAB7769744.1 putative peptide maturation dehydrogenase [Xanthomonas maliensis]